MTINNVRPFRTRFAKDIVCEFLPPRKKSNKVVIMCPGFPSPSPGRDRLLNYWSQKGYWAFAPRYRGVWESAGTMLSQTPAKDLKDVIGGLNKGFRDFLFDRKFSVKPSKIILFGSSYGSVPALLFGAEDKRVDKIVIFSPLVDWADEGPDEPLDWLIRFIDQAFGKAFRINKANWNKLKTGKLFNPVNVADKIDGRKVLFIHAKDDRSVPYRSVKKFADAVKCRLVTLSKGGHLSSALVTRPRFSRLVSGFIK